MYLSTDVPKDGQEANVGYTRSVKVTWKSNTGPSNTGMQVRCRKERVPISYRLVGYSIHDAYIIVGP